MKTPRFIVIKEDLLEMEEKYRYYCTYDSSKPVLEDWHLAIGQWIEKAYVIIETNNSFLYPKGYTIKMQIHCWSK